MGIIYKDNININDLELAYIIEKDNYFKSLEEYKKALDSSKYIIYAYENDKLIGLARALSEGVETAFIIGSFVIDNLKYKDIKKELIVKLEELLIGKRKMLLANPKDINFYENLGYLRCKNAYTYINFDIKDYDGYFLPKGYLFETELYREKISKKLNLNKNIIYMDNIDKISFEEINDTLTKAFFNRPHDINKTKEAFINSEYFSIAYDENKIVGVARAISDGHYATILNVAVNPEYQGLNIGRNLVINLSKQLNDKLVVLNTHAGSAGFYNKIEEYRRNKTVFEKGPSNNSFHIGINEMFLPKGFKFIDEY